ncbi:hypothetical protein LCGC14_0391600 [marine sediment metagenome]|uniref:Portal protein n=1 Tax=marine sediment metagenome TaxID=412755 RepID=A0A0F9T5C4_9ZZZZ
MPKPQFDSSQIGSIIRELQQEYSEHNAQLRVRRMLLEMDTNAKAPGNANRTGLAIVPPFDKSKLIVKTMVGDVVDANQHYTARIAANDPQVAVLSTTLGNEKVSKTAEAKGAEQERLLTSMWFAAGGRDAQYQVAWSQSWGRVGYYLTLPQDVAFGLPERTYHGDITDEEIETLKRSGSVTPSRIADPSDGEFRYAESGTSWLDRRRDAAKGHAIAGRSLNTLEALPPDMVWPRYDPEGLKYVAVIEEVPASEFAAGSDLAKAAARYTRQPETEIDRYGFYLDKKGRIQGGITTGVEPGAPQQSTRPWTFIRFITRSEVYYLVGGPGRTDDLQLIWWQEHGDGVVPVIPVPSILTDSRTPGGRHSSPMESVFTLAPPLAQLLTLMSSVSVWNALPRFVVEDAQGRLVLNKETGEPQEISSEPGIGFDPKDIVVAGGKVKQLTIDAGTLIQLLEFYVADMERKAPQGITPGAVGASTPAWSVRQFIAEEQAALQQPVSHNASAVAQVMKIWNGRMRRLDSPIFFLSAPGHRVNEEKRRGLIEFVPSDLVDSIEVTQNSNTASDRIVLAQAGLDLRQSGTIDDHELYADYFLKPDPEDSILRKYVQLVMDHVMGGIPAPPDSLIAAVVDAVRGQVFFEQMENNPNLAIATAERMAQLAQEEMAKAQQAEVPAGGVPGGGGPADAAGIVQPGMGMPITQGGSPQAGAPAAPLAPPVAVQ